MPFLALPFPAFDPVLVSIGPFAIRWYALAYIFGILLGWLYARAHHPQRDALGRQGAADGRPISTITSSGSRSASSSAAASAMCCSTTRLISSRIRARSSSSGTAACRSMAALPAACSRWCCSRWRRKIPVLSLGDLTCAVGPIGLFLGRLANFINGELWGRPSDVPWAMVFPGAGPLPRHPSQLYEAALEGLLLLLVLAIAVRAGALKRPGLIIGLFAIVYAHRAQLLRNLPRARSAAWLSVRRPYHGHAAVGAAVPRGRRLCGLRAEASGLRVGADMDGASPSRTRNPPPDRGRGTDAGRAIHVALPDASGIRLLRHARSVRRRPAISPPRRKSARCSASCSDCGPLSVWKMMGSPDNVRLIELGPGRGTMMRDALRAMNVAPAFRKAIVVHLVEVSPTLEKVQRETLEQIRRADSLASHVCPKCRRGRRSFSPTNSSTRCRFIRWSGRPTAGTSAWSRSMPRAIWCSACRAHPVPNFDRVLPKKVQATRRSDRSTNGARTMIAFEIGRRVRDNGAALIIDYGHSQSDVGDTLQAMGQHAFADALSAPGSVDITAHVDFEALGRRRKAWAPPCMARSSRAISCCVSASRRAPMP